MRLVGVSVGRFHSKKVTVSWPGSWAESPPTWPNDQVSQISGYDPPEVTRCPMGARIVEVGWTKEVFSQGIRILMDEMEGVLVQ